MQPLTLRLPGEFWDSFLYKGRLLLFGRDGSLLGIDWDALIDSLGRSKYAPLVAQCGFRQSNYLYGDQLSLFFQNDGIVSVLRRQFDEAGESPLALDESDVTPFVSGNMDNPFPFPHAESLVYADRIFVGGPSGVFQAGATKRTKGPISTRAKQITDLPCTGLSAGWGTLAVAAGDEGLWQCEIDKPARDYRWPPEEEDELAQLAAKPCNRVEWTYCSIFASQRAGGYLADFQLDREPDVNGYGRNNDELPDDPIGTLERTRKLREVISAEQIFGALGTSWGCQDKLYSAAAGTIRVAKYRPWAEDGRIRGLGTIAYDTALGELVSGAVAPFGTVLEFDEALLIVLSNGERFVVEGEPVNWRVYPRARHYTNQLHVIRHSCLEVFSFNQDYFVSQEEKLAGVLVRAA